MLKQLAKILSGSNEQVVKKLNSDVEDINDLEPEFGLLSDGELEAKTQEFKNRLIQGEDLEDIFYEAFAAVREASKRTLGQRHFDAQLMGGIVLHEGKIAEMKTGEGKTLVATLPAYLNALSGKGVHVVTVNDYLSRRDAQWMGEIYHRLGLSVGMLQHNASYLYEPSFEEDGSEQRGIEKLLQVERRVAYQADITYGTNNEFGFDYLRDNMVVDLSQRVQRELAYAIVDEVDNILIDEARTPLIVSGPAEESPAEYQRFARLAPTLQEGTDYTIDEKHRVAALTTDGIAKLERMLKVKNLYAPENIKLVHFIENALKAKAIFVRDREYVIKDGEVVIVDEFTGRLMPGRRYSDGLHQALEAKEGLAVQRETITYATITLQNYFRLYRKLAGMTGTAVTEAEEFFKIYKLEVVEIPTNLPMIREDHSDFVYADQKAKYSAVVQEIEKRSKAGQPVLVGTTDIAKSELLSDQIKKRGVRHEVLNAKQHEREASIIAEAGRPGAVTVATNMAGRGTDIVLGGNPEALGIDKNDWERDHQKVIELGGLMIIGTERHEARRIDNQLRGRAGRQGDPGSSRFYVALDDDLMKRFGGDRIKAVMNWAGLEDDAPLENKMMSRSIEGAQTKVEGHHFDIRKHLVDYDDVVNTQRSVIYAERDKILSGSDLRDNIISMIEVELSEIVSRYTDDTPAENWDINTMLSELNAIYPLPENLSNVDAVYEMDPTELRERLVQGANSYYESLEQSVTSDVMRSLERQVMLRLTDAHWVQHLTAMENLRQGIGLHAYGQRDPLVMYKHEGFQMFQGLQERIQSSIAHAILHIAVTGGTQKPSLGGNRVENRNGGQSIMTKVVGVSNKKGLIGRKKLGRNDPCDCGSGKKYKRCHGA
ncbi:MAG: preprotein translocase subunit SecA [SAR202 cluster bacterium]|jgi:preprotein translocase subunit SecA|nr:preprotein translocase subunit SecA [SAR202 cluster bacterium]